MDATISHEPARGKAPEDLADPLDRVIAAYERDGFAPMPGLLGPRAAELRALIDRSYDADPRVDDSFRYGFVLARLFELDRAFRDLLVLEPIISIAERILGANCHLVAQNVVRNHPGQAIDGWHVDEEVFFPRMDDGDGLGQAMPSFVMTVQILLSDVPDVDHGPSQYVPGSHRAGRHPPAAADEPCYRGRGPVSLLGRAGDVYLHNGQCWHRGAPNRSTRTRYLLQLAFGRRWVAQRFHPFIDYRMPDHVWDGAGDRLQRVLGRHPKGPYG